MKLLEKLNLFLTEKRKFTDKQLFDMNRDRVRQHGSNDDLDRWIELHDIAKKMGLPVSWEKLKKKVKNLSEATEADDFAGKIQKTIEKIFPKSFVHVRFKKNLGKSIQISFLLGKDKSEWINGIPENDPMKHMFFIWLDRMGDDNIIPDKISIELSQGGSLYVMPKEGSHLAYDSVKIGWRKKTGTPEQILKHIDDYFKKAMKVLKNNKDRMDDRHSHLAKKY